MYEYKNPYILDFTNIKNYKEMHLLFKEVFDFPDYYGENWSAFWDCLTDMVDDPIHIHIYGLNVFQGKFSEECSKMFEIFERLRHWNDDRYIDDISIKVIS